MVLIINCGGIKRSKVSNRGERSAFAYNHFITDLHVLCSLPRIIDPNVINSPDIYYICVSVSALAGSRL